MKNFSGQAFLIATVSVGFLLIPCFIAAWAESEGTLGSSNIWETLAKTFYVLRFPTHTLFPSVLLTNGYLFLGGLIFNCIFFGFIIERLVSLVKIKRPAA